MGTFSWTLVTLTILFQIATLAQGLECYTCVNCDKPNTEEKKLCREGEDSCYKVKTSGNASLKGCLARKAPAGCHTADGTTQCVCNENLCNGMGTAGASLLLLLVCLVGASTVVLFGN